MSEEIKEEEKQLTPEQYAEARAKAMTHLKKEIEYLTVEKEYETLVADVEEAKTRGITMIAQRAQFFARQEAAAAAQQEEEEATTSGNKRPLKKD